MVFNLEQLSLACPHHLWLEFSEKEQEKAVSVRLDYSHDAASHRAFLNRLTLAVLLPVLQAESEAFTQITSPENIWEFVTGFAISLGKNRLVIIASETIDTDEFSVPQEWVDIPEWAADYYLAVQVNLEDGWLRVWGFTTHRKLKNEGRYDRGDRTYSLNGEDLFEHLNTLWVSLKLCQGEKALIEPLPVLSSNQIEMLLVELGKPSLYSPRLKIPFAQWGALLAADNSRQELYQRRLENVPNIVQLGKNIFPDWWLMFDELVQACNLNLSFARSGARSGDNEERTPGISRGRVIDLGIQLAGNSMALIVHFTKESENKHNILLQVNPGGGQTYLPPDVELIVLDDTGDVFLEARSRSADNWIQLEFRGEPGERFSVKVALGDASIMEYFAI